MTEEIVDFNIDGYGNNLSTVLNNLLRYKNTEDGYEFELLSDLEIDKIFRGDNLIRKIICLYPESAQSLGFVLENSVGEVVNNVEENKLLEAFCEASIMARKYGKVFLLMQDERENHIEFSKGSKIKSFKCLFDLSEPVANFYEHDNKKIHASRIFLFLGNKTFLKDVGVYDMNYADSILQSLKRVFFNFSNSNDVAVYILANLSYLTVGIEGLDLKTSTDEGKNKIQERLNSINLNRSVNRLLAHDMSKETIGFINQTISSVTDVLENIKNILVSYTDYPKDKLFEDAEKTNLGSGISNQLIARMLWADRLQNWVEKNWLENYQKYFDTVMKEKVTVKIPFNVQMTELEKAEIQKLGAERLKALIEAGIITPSEARTGYRGDEFTLNIVLDDDSLLEKEDNEKQQLLTASAPKPTDNSNQESLTKPTQQKDSQEDAQSVPDSVWEELANVTQDDLKNVANSVLEA